MTYFRLPASYFDPPDGPECPACGDAIEGDKYEGSCVNEDCDYTYEANYEDIAESRSARYDYE